ASVIGQFNDPRLVYLPRYMDNRLCPGCFFDRLVCRGGLVIRAGRIIGFIFVVVRGDPGIVGSRLISDKPPESEHRCHNDREHEHSRKCDFGPPDRWSRLGIVWLVEVFSHALSMEASTWCL